MASYIDSGCTSSEGSRSPSPSRASSNTTISQRPSLSSMSSRCASSFAYSPSADIGMTEALRMSSIDVINRYDASSCTPIKRCYSEYNLKPKANAGIQILRDPDKNKGNTSFIPSLCSQLLTRAKVPRFLLMRELQKTLMVSFLTFLRLWICSVSELFG